MKQRDVWRLTEKLACGEPGMIASNVRYSQQEVLDFPPDCAMHSLLMFSDRIRSESRPVRRRAAFHCNFPEDAGRVA
jgi:hypothetical protein